MSSTNTLSVGSAPGVLARVKAVLDAKFVRPTDGGFDTPLVVFADVRRHNLTSVQRIVVDDLGSGFAFADGPVQFANARSVLSALMVSADGNTAFDATVLRLATGLLRAIVLTQTLVRLTASDQISRITGVARWTYASDRVVFTGTNSVGATDTAGANTLATVDVVAVNGTNGVTGTVGIVQAFMKDGRQRGRAG